MVKHRHAGRERWVLPGGGVDEGEDPRKAVLRELREECNVEGTVVHESGFVAQTPEETTHTFVVEIGKQTPCLGTDPEFGRSDQILADVAWMTVAELPEKVRAFLRAAGLLDVKEFSDRVSN